MKKLIKILLSACLISALLVSCKTFEKNLARAEKAVASARSVHADEYAAEPYNSAISDLDSAKELKESDKKAANGKLLTSIENADEAYYKALKEFSKNQEMETQKAKSGADDVNASVLSKDKYDEAENYYEKASADSKKIDELSSKLKKLETEEEK